MYRNMFCDNDSAPGKLRRKKSLPTVWGGRINNVDRPLLSAVAVLSELFFSFPSNKANKNKARYASQSQADGCTMYRSRWQQQITLKKS
jgi:hypothetical protein